jgi:hypothetical protein
VDSGQLFEFSFAVHTNFAILMNSFSPLFTLHIGWINSKLGTLMLGYWRIFYGQAIKFVHYFIDYLFQLTTTG